MADRPTYTEPVADLRAAFAATIPPWLPRHVWWIQRACAGFLLVLSVYAIRIGEPLTAAMLSAAVVFFGIRNLRR